MNTHIHMLWTICVAFAIVATGCEGPPGHTSFAVTLASGQTAVTKIQLGSQRCILLSKVMAQQPTYTPENYYRCFGAHPLPGGQRVDWKCEDQGRSHI